MKPCIEDVQKAAVLGFDFEIRPNCRKPKPCPSLDKKSRKGKKKLKKKSRKKKQKKRKKKRYKKPKKSRKKRRRKKRDKTY